MGHKLSMGSVPSAVASLTLLQKWVPRSSPPLCQRRVPPSPPSFDSSGGGFLPPWVSCCIFLSTGVVTCCLDKEPGRLCKDCHMAIVTRESFRGLRSRLGPELIYSTPPPSPSPVSLRREWLCEGSPRWPLPRQPCFCRESPGRGPRPNHRKCLFRRSPRTNLASLTVLSPKTKQDQKGLSSLALHLKGTDLPECCKD